MGTRLRGGAGPGESGVRRGARVTLNVFPEEKGRAPAAGKRWDQVWKLPPINKWGPAAHLRPGQGCRECL